MSLISFKFFVFCILLYVIYFCVGYFTPKFQWLVLLIASYFFYIFASVKFLPFLLFTTLSTWFFPLLMQRYTDSKKSLLGLCIILNIGTLFTLKYSGFFLDLMGMNINYKFILPLGISFYTFQSLGYCIDTYRGEVKPEKNFFKYALFVSFFPQICQGPIGNYSQLEVQLFNVHFFDYPTFKRGLIRIIEGYFKKVFIADTLAVFVDSVYANYSSFSGLILFAASICYTVQIYADFSGYMDIVIGCSNCLGINLRENFRTPYLSSSFSEFWKSWHISLTSWFRNYLYIPLGGNRKGTLRKYLNKIIVFLVSGLWHGADMSFVFWGGMHGALLVGEEIINGARKEKNCKSKANRLFHIVITFIFVNFAWILFRADSINSAFWIIKTIFANSHLSGITGELLSISGKFYYLIAFFATLCMLAFDLIEKERLFSDRIMLLKNGFQWGILYLFLLVITFSLIMSSGQTVNAANFIYFNF